MIKDFYDTLYDLRDHACFGKDKWGIEVFPRDWALENPGIYQFATVNAQIEGTTRAQKNVTKYRTMLFEIDEDSNKNKVHPKVQAQIIKQSGLPYSCAVWSGSKSIHWTVSVTRPLSNKAEYQAYWRAIFHILNTTANELGFDLKFDESVKDPARFTRIPGTINDKTGNESQLITVNGRIKNDDLGAWINSHNVSVESYLPKPRVVNPEFAGKTNPDAELQERVDYIEEKKMKGMRYEDGNYNYQYKLAWFLLATGMTVDEIEAYYISRWNHIHENEPVKGAAKSSEPCEPLYVFTKRNKREWRLKKLAEERAVLENKIRNYHYE